MSDCLSEVQTIENTREKDVTMIAPEDAEVEADDADDEFASMSGACPSHFSCSNVLALGCRTSFCSVLRSEVFFPTLCAQCDMVTFLQATSIGNKRPMCSSPPATDPANSCFNF